ncbi:MAG: hypothetical protein ACI9EF_001620 [Pseudohongiellaceae bacterium]|jgi:hypothetical protein
MGRWSQGHVVPHRSQRGSAYDTAKLGCEIPARLLRLTDDTPLRQRQQDQHDSDHARAALSALGLRQWQGGHSQNALSHPLWGGHQPRCDLATFGIFGAVELGQEGLFAADMAALSGEWLAIWPAQSPWSAARRTPLQAPPRACCYDEGMDRLVATQLFSGLRKILVGPEALLLAMVVMLIETAGPSSVDDGDDVLWVVLLPMLFVAACSMARHRRLPLTVMVIDWAVASFSHLRRKLVLSLGLDFHPKMSPRPERFMGLARGVACLALAAAVLLPAQGLLREVLLIMRVRGLYSIYVLALGALWAWLLSGIVLQIPAIVLAILEVIKRRSRLRSSVRIGIVSVILVGIGGLLYTLDAATGATGCLALLACGCCAPLFLRPEEPPAGPWLNIAVGSGAKPKTARISDVVRGVHGFLALQAFLLVVLFAPRGVEPVTTLPITDALVRTYGWLAAWLFTGSAWMAVSEFNRRRRLFDPAFPRSNVLWATTGPEATALELERHFVERSGWRLVISDALPGLDDADLLVGMPSSGALRSAVPLTKIPPAVFLLDDDASAVLNEAEERDKAERSIAVIQRLLVTSRPGLGDRGEGTFLVPHCWLVVGLTRDDDRGGVERNGSMTFGQSFQAALGTRLRRFFFEVMTRAGIDVLFIEDSVTTEQVSQVLEALMEHHISRAEPGLVAEHDFVGIEGVRVVLHEVQPEAEGIPGVDANATRHAISRARIMIIGRDRKGGDDDDGPPSEGESSDLWLKESLSSIWSGVQLV